MDWMIGQDIWTVQLEWTIDRKMTRNENELNFTNMACIQ